MGAVAQLTDLSPLFKKHVTFSDHSESGYSSTTQRDEGIKQRMNLQNLKLANQGSPHHDNAALLQRMNMSEKQKLSDTNQHHSEFSLKNPSHPIPPVYYDPLHLQNFSSFEKLSGTEQQLSESGSREEKFLSKNPKNAKNENKVTQNMSSLNPIQSRFIPSQPPVFVSIDHDPVVPFFAHDLSRVSAFTPVKPANPHSSISRTEHKMLPHQFTPSKGPNVFECVGSIPDHSHVNPRNTISSNHYTTSKLETSKPVVDSNDIRSGSPNPHKMSSLNEILKAESNKRTFQNDPSYDSPLSSSGASNDDTLPTLKNDVLRLRRYFDSVGGKEMKRHLRNLVDSNNCDVIKALILLFPSTVTHHVEGHCVRCHKTFNPGERSRCFLPHPELMVEKISQDEEETNFICHCCNTAFRLLKMDFYEENTNALLTGHCYSGQHTTDPDSVDYRNERGAAKSCEESGCVEFYV